MVEHHINACPCMHYFPLHSIVPDQASEAALPSHGLVVVVGTLGCDSVLQSTTLVQFIQGYSACAYNNQGAAIHIRSRRALTGRIGICDSLVKILLNEENCLKTDK